MPSAKELAKALAYQGEIRNTPQNSFLGGIANFLAPVSEFADRDKLPGSIPLLGGMSFADLSGLKGAESLVRDMSYGKSPVRGATLNTVKVDPRLLDVAAVSGAMIPVGKALGKAALRNVAEQVQNRTGIARFMPDTRTSVVPEGASMPQRPKTEFEILHDTAQRNAALPVEQGGLGLPSGNTAIDRAGAMGFDTPAYHGTNRALTEFSLTKAGDKTGNPNSSLGVFSTPNTDEASRYASNWGTDGGNVIPLLVRGGNTYQMPYKELDDHAMLPYRLLQQDPSYDANSVIKFGDMAGQREAASRLSKAEELAQIEVQKRRSFLQSEGYDSAIVSPGKKMEERIVFDPANIRSRFAAFDPFRRHEADILAGVGVGGMLDPQAIAEALRQQDRK